MITRQLRWLVYICLFIFSLVRLDTGLAGSSLRDRVDVKPIPVEVSFDINHIYSMNAEENMYTLNYKLIYSWQGDQQTEKNQIYHGAAAKQFIKTHWTPGLSFVNNAEKSEITHLEVFTDHQHVIHVEEIGVVKLFAQYYFKNYPFETQRFPIKLSSMDPNVVINTSNNAIHIADASKLMLWEMRALRFSTKEVLSDFTDDSFSVLTIELFLKRNSLYYLTRMYVPLLIFILFTSAVMFYPGSDLKRKIPVLLTCLVLISLFSLRVSGQIPPVNYLTRLDHVVSITRIWLVLIFAHSVYEYIYRDKPKVIVFWEYSRGQILSRVFLLSTIVGLWIFAILNGLSL